MYFKILNLIKINLMLKNKIIKTSINKNDLQIINVLLKLNVINNVKKIKFTKNTFFINLNINNNYKNITNLYKPSKLVFLKKNDIIKINRKKSFLFYITTNKGLINNFDAEKLNVGGILVFKL